MDLINLLLFGIMIILYLRLLKTENTVNASRVILLSLLIAFCLRYEGHTADISRYIHLPEKVVYMNFSDLFLGGDFFFHLVAKILSYFTTEPRVFAVIICAIYMLLFRQSLNIVLCLPKKGIPIPFLLSTSLLLIYSFVNINAMRFGTATVYYLWCILEIIIKKNKKFYGMIFLTPFIHFSYWIFVFLPFIALGLKRRLEVAIILMVVSFAIAGSDISIRINSFVSDNFSSEVATKTSLYASEEGLDYMNQRYEVGFQEKNLLGKIAALSFPIKNYFIGILLLILCLFNRNKIKQDDYYCRFYILQLIAFSLANFASSVSNGDRFYHTATLITVYFTFVISFFICNNTPYTIGKNELTIYRLILIVAIIYGVLKLYASRYLFM